MRYNPIPRSDLKVSEISLGCWTMGGLNWVDGKPNGWANVNEDDIVEAIRKAVDAGVNHFDNADVYGNGRAERMLARVLRKLGLKSTDFVIATKVGHFKGTAEHAYDPLHIRHQCEQSLKNLGRDVIDIYYFHHGDFGPEGALLDDAVATMNSLVQEGKVRAKGQSAYSFKDFQQAVPKVQPSVIQSWAHAMDPKFILPESATGKLMAEMDVRFVAFSPLAQGRLLDKFNPANPPVFEEGDHRKNNPGFKAEALAELKPRLEQLKQRFGASTGDLASMALRYVLEHPNVACVIPGFRNARQVTCNLSGAARELSSDDIRFIRSVLGG